LVNAWACRIGARKAGERVHLVLAGERGELLRIGGANFFKPPGEK
jgi:hypothetical protein